MMNRKRYLVDSAFSIDLRHIPLILLGGLLIGALMGCDTGPETKGTDPTPIPYFDSCERFEFNIVELPYDQRPYTNAGPGILADTNKPHDSAGIQLFEWKGKLYYHPVNMCQRALAFLDLYHDHGDSAYLRTAEKYLERLFLESKEFGEAVYFPYRFDYKVHNRDDAFLAAPFYSGMAQGQALSATTRMFNETGDSTYLRNCHRIFNSFLRPRATSTPWTVFTDERGCFWVEEYVTEPVPSMTLNGFIFGIYGLYDYYLLTGRDTTFNLLQATLSTAKNYIPLYRRPGRPSLYGLTFKHFAADYHMLHIRQFRQLYRMTGDDFFRHWADTFETDFILEE